MLGPFHKEDNLVQNAVFCFAFVSIYYLLTLCLVT